MVLAVLFKPLTPGLLQQYWAGYGKRPGVLGPNVPDVPTHTCPVAVKLPATACPLFIPLTTVQQCKQNIIFEV